MPVVSRARLRQQVGLTKMRDTYVGTVTASYGAVGSVTIIDGAVANLAFSGEGLYVRTWLKVNGMELRVASFNAGSGAYVTLQTAATVVPSGAPYERHEKLSPTEKDRAIDGLISHIWTRQEVPINVVDGRLDFSIGTGFHVFGAYQFANPAGSGTRDPRVVPIAAQIVTTATGRELRLQAGSLLGSGQQLILDAQVRATLGAADAATVNIPDEDWVLNGIAARCYQTLIADSPSQEGGKYADLARAYAQEFRRLSSRFIDSGTYDWRNAFGAYVA